MNQPSSPSTRPRRRKFVVKGVYQNQFAAAVVAFQINVGILYVGIMQFRVQQIVDRAYDVEALQTTNWWSAFLPWILVISFAVGIVVWGLSLYFSNTIVGPMPRLQNALRAMAAGDYSQRLKFRPGDAIEEVADDVNALAESLQARFDAERRNEAPTPSAVDAEASIEEPEPAEHSV